MGAAGLCGLRRPYFLRAIAEVLRSGATLEIGAASETGRSQEKAGSAQSCEESARSQAEECSLCPFSHNTSCKIQEHDEDAQANVKLQIAWIGKTKEPAFRALTDEYLKRISRYVSAESHEMASEAALLDLTEAAAGRT